MTLDFLKQLKPRRSSLMGLTIEGRRLEGIVLSRGKDRLLVRLRRPRLGARQEGSSERRR